MKETLGSSLSLPPCGVTARRQPAATWKRVLTRTRRAGPLVPPPADGGECVSAVYCQPVCASVPLPSGLSWEAGRLASLCLSASHTRSSFPYSHLSLHFRALPNLPCGTGPPPLTYLVPACPKVSIAVLIPSSFSFLLTVRRISLLWSVNNTQVP